MLAALQIPIQGQEDLRNILVTILEIVPPIKNFRSGTSYKERDLRGVFPK
jgi:hypothetical protein